jgi:hypothetical protein
MEAELATSLAFVSTYLCISLAQGCTFGAGAAMVFIGNRQSNICSKFQYGQQVECCRTPCAVYAVRRRIFRQRLLLRGLAGRVGSIPVGCRVPCPDSRQKRIQCVWQDLIFDGKCCLSLRHVLLIVSRGRAKVWRHSS